MHDPELRRRMVTWRRQARELARGLLDTVLPPVCAACGVPADGLCAVCRRNLRRRPARGCARCGEPRPPAGAPGTRPGMCGGDHRALRGLVQLVAPFRFVGAGGELVRRFKLDGDAAAGRLLVRAMADCHRQAPARQRRPVVVSVPLHRARRRRRGFDQAAWLALGLARRLGLTSLPGLLVRTRGTRPQGHALVTSRDENVRGAFAVRDAGLLVGRCVLLVDDVFTSGATARACAAELRRAGARNVAIAVACRS